MIIALLRLRSESEQMGQTNSFNRVLKRCIHWWTQHVEQNIEFHFLKECPDMTLGAAYHPYLKSSRAKGNKSMQMSLVGRWQARGSGYVSLKGETTLKSLGIISERSRLGETTAMEYVARLLDKTACFVQQKVSSGLRVLNFCFDAAMVAEESVS